MSEKKTFSAGTGDDVICWNLKNKYIRLVSAKAKRPNHPSHGGGVASQGGSASQGEGGVKQPRGGQPAKGGGVLHDNDADMTP